MSAQSRYRRRGGDFFDETSIGLLLRLVQEAASVEGQREEAGARARQTVSVMVDGLLDADPLTLYCLWQADSGVHLNLTMLRRLSTRLYQWREPTASLEVLRSVVRLSGKEPDVRRLRRREDDAAVLFALDGQLPDGRARSAAPHSSVVHVVDSLADPGSAHEAEHLAAVQRDAGYNAVVVQFAADKTGSDGPGWYEIPVIAGADSGDLQTLFDIARTRVTSKVPEDDVAVVVAHGGLLSAMGGRTLSTRLHAPLLYVQNSDRLGSWVDGIARTLGMGDAPSTSRYRAEGSELHALCARWDRDLSVFADHSFVRSPSARDELRRSRGSRSGVTLVPRMATTTDIDTTSESSSTDPTMETDVVLVVASGSADEHEVLLRSTARMVALSGHKLDAKVVALNVTGPDVAQSADLTSLQELADRLPGLSSVEALTSDGIDALFAQSRLCIVAPAPGSATTTSEQIADRALVRGCVVLVPAAMAGWLHPLPKQVATCYELDEESLPSELVKALRRAPAREVVALDVGRSLKQRRSAAVHRLWEPVLHDMGGMPAEQGQPGSVHDIESICSQMRDTEVPDPAGWFPEHRRTSASQVLEGGWKFAEFPRIDLSLPLDWDSMCIENRSWNFQLHTWKFMDPVIREYLRSGDKSLLRWCLDRTRSWIERFVGRDPGATMAWYDMSLGLRSTRLAVLIWLACRAGMPTDYVSALLRCADAHATEHRKEESFNPRTNHGYYAALGQKVLGDMLEGVTGMDDLAREGADRLKLMVATQFKGDGGHAEHSPEYHRMVSSSFENAIEQRIITDPDVVERIARAAYVLGWLVQPNGRLVQFGDSPASEMVGKERTSSDPHTLYLLSDQKEGTPLEKELESFPETGYAIVRSPQPSSDVSIRESSYLALQAAFHSRAHKHADDLTLVWYDRGDEIIVDGGRYGYGELLPANSPLRSDGFYYASEERQYVESSLAHNTVTVGGRNHDRRREPYGSGIGESEARPDGSFVLSGFAPHKNWRHERTLVFRPGLELRVLDNVDVDVEQEVDVCVWFNLNGAVTVDVVNRHLVKVTREDWDVPLWISQERDDALLEEPVRGQDHPIRGWRSVTDRKMIPTWLLGWRFKTESRVSSVTHFRFSANSPGKTGAGRER